MHKDLTVLLREMNSGDRLAADLVAEAVDHELRQLARGMLAGSRQQTLQPTALVSEAWLRLLRGAKVDWQSQQHFFAIAARTMRHIVVDHFRERNAQKRFPSNMQIPLEDAVTFNDDRQEEALIVDQALLKLKEWDPRAAQVVELRYFGGLTVPQAAQVLNVAEKTVIRDWKIAQAWLKRFLESSSELHATV